MFKVPSVDIIFALAFRLKNIFNSHRRQFFHVSSGQCISRPSYAPAQSDMRASLSAGMSRSSHFTEKIRQFCSLYLLSGLVVRAFALRVGGRGFESRPRHTKGVKMVPDPLAWRSAFKRVNLALLFSRP